MQTFQINVFIRFLTFYARLQPHGFIIRKTVCTRSFYMVRFSCICVSSLAGGRGCSVHTYIHTHIHKRTKNIPYKNNACKMIMHPWGSKYVEDVENRIKALIWKVCISLVHVAELHQNARSNKLEIQGIPRILQNQKAHRHSQQSDIWFILSQIELRTNSDCFTVQH